MTDEVGTIREWAERRNEADGGWGSLAECAKANARDPLLPGSYLSTPLIGIMANPLL
jgi:hypothetical protein